tara:strand:- start:3776 stop:4186 length:411 start_codon:yes stop_codon:yes gene_type:complete
MSIKCDYNGSVGHNGKTRIICKYCGNFKPFKSYTTSILKNKELEMCNTCHDKIKGKYMSGDRAIYKHQCLEQLRKLKIGEYIVVHDRTKYTINSTWLWRVNCHGTSRIRVKGSKKKFKVESITHTSHKIIRMGDFK